MVSFDGLIKQFSNFKFLNKSGGSVLGIDIGTSSIKVAQLKKHQGSVVLQTYGELALGPYADVEIGRATNLSVEKLTEALKDILREANVTTQNCGTAIPFASSLISVLDFPVVDPKQLATMIPIEARKYIPVPISEVTLDWFIIPDEELGIQQEEEVENVEKKKEKEKPAKTRVLLVAIHNETLELYRKVLEGAGLHSTFYEIEIFSTLRAVLDNTIAPGMIVDVGAATTKLFIVEAGIVQLSHIINRGSQDITLSLSRSTNMSVAKAEELKRIVGLLGSASSKNDKAVAEAAATVFERIFSEANRVLVNYQQRYNKNIRQVIITGGGGVLKGLLPVARKHFETEVMLADPFSKTTAPAFLEETLKEAGPAFAVSVGLALRKLEDIS